MRQSRRQSLSESLVSVVVGYLIALATQVVVFPWFGLQATMSDNIVIAAIFTFVSVIRTYFVRRAFNAWNAREN